MTTKELKRKSRLELVEIIAQQKKRELELNARIEELEKLVQERNVKLANAGSIAEAALSLSGVFEAAQEAADIYLRSLNGMGADLKNRTEKPIAPINLSDGAYHKQNI